MTTNSSGPGPKNSNFRFDTSNCLVGYCTNVHAGTSLIQVKENLTRHTLNVKQQVRPGQTMGVGLWLSNAACLDLSGSEELSRFSDWLQQHDLEPFTFNGFPFADFHQDVVKHQVYLPTWADNARLDYTLGLAKIQTQLLSHKPESTRKGSISTLPIGWPGGSGGSSSEDELFKEAAYNLRHCADGLYELHQETGCHVFLSIEPEPGCLIDTVEDFVDFMKVFRTGIDSVDERRLRYIGACHDICHSAVMFESQEHALQTYRKHGIRIGKFQVSSAIELKLRDSVETAEILDELREFDEPKYLHQTVIKAAEWKAFYEDLRLALAEHQSQTTSASETWRVHFHVPLFLESIGLLATTQGEIRNCLNHIEPNADWPIHFELETYAWSVLPSRKDDFCLADGIIREFQWFDDLLRDT